MINLDNNNWKNKKEIDKKKIFYNKEELLKKFTKKEKNELNLNNYYIEDNERYSPKICLVIIGLYVALFILDFMIYSWLPLIMMILIALVVWIYSLLSVIKNDFKKENNKIIWIVLLIFLPFTAILYPDFRKVQIIKKI